MAQKDAADTRAVVEAQNAKVNEALAAFDDLRRKLVERSASRPGIATLEFGAEGGATLDINGLTSETAVDAAADYAVLHDASATANRKVLVKAILEEAIRRSWMGL